MKPLAIAFVILFLAGPVALAQLAGKYTDGKLTADFSDQGNGSFTGTLTLNGQPYPATAHAGNAGFAGSFTASGTNYDFTASLANDTLTLTTSGTTYSLAKVKPRNPLEAPAAADPLAGYAVTSSTDTGKALLGQKPDATSVKAAFEQTFPDLARYFGARPQIGSACEDAHDHHSGVATFTTTLNGAAVKGFVSCKLIAGKGASVAIIYDRADANKAEWDRLTSPSTQPPADSSAPAVDLSKALGNDAQQYDFPDGTGSVTLAAGWKTQAQSATSPIGITGPADQTVVIGNAFNICEPDSPMVQMIQRNQAMMRRMGGNPPPPPPLLVAPFTDPVTAMKDVGPQLSKIIAARGGPKGHMDQIISTQDIPCDLKDGKAAIVCFDVTREYPDGRVGHYRTLGTIHMAMIGNGTWIYCFTGCSSPKETFDQDKPVMLAMIKSLKLNAEVCQQRMHEQQEQSAQMLKNQMDDNNARLQQQHDQFMHDQAQRFADGQARHAEQMAGYAQHNAQWKADELQKSRNNADFVETIRGTRTVYDRATGESATVDLNYATGVVDSLNQAALDPNRFVQIPLRDEMYPR
jgi:hypothetical protein